MVYSNTSNSQNEYGKYTGHLYILNDAFEVQFLGL